MSSESAHELSYAQCELLMALVGYKNTSFLTTSQIARDFHISPCTPRFRDLIHILQDKQAIEVVGRAGPSIFLKLNHSKLKSVLWSDPKIQRFVKYFEKHHGAIFL